MTLSNGQSFSLGQYPEPWWFRLMRPVQDRDD